jgi:hypothetical protein
MTTISYRRRRAAVSYRRVLPQPWTVKQMAGPPRSIGVSDALLAERSELTGVGYNCRREFHNYDARPRGSA